VDSEGMVHDVKIELETEVKSPEKSIPQQDELDEGGKWFNIGKIKEGTSREKQ
jgi:hypothetical protein